MNKEKSLNNEVKLTVTESSEFELKKSLEEKRKSIKTFEDLTAFLEYVKNNCNSGYGEAPRAIAQASLAVAWYLSSAYGITGFQASCAMWDFIQGWTKTHNECGLRLVDYDDMLFPQYNYKFDKIISSDVWKNLQEQAEKLLADKTDYVHPNVLAHWKSIVDGKVPFGYSVTEENM